MVTKRKQTAVIAGRNPKLTTAADKNRFEVAPRSLNIEHDGSKINIKEHSKQVYTTQWSGKWEKNVFSLTSEHKIMNCRARHASLSNDITSQNTRFHWSLLNLQGTLHYTRSLTLQFSQLDREFFCLLQYFARH